MANFHKSNVHVPLRPMGSVVETAEYDLAKFLDSLIKPPLQDMYSLKSTSQFMDQVKHFKFNKNQIMVSFSAVSLFTNVPLSETIEIIGNRPYSEDGPLLNQLPFKEEVFKKLMFCANQGLSMYKDRLYKQIDRVTMGSPLGRTIVNFFLGYVVEKVFADQTICLPKLYLRYIDDIFSIFNNNDDCNEFLKYSTGSAATSNLQLKNNKELSFFKL